MGAVPTESLCHHLLIAVVAAVVVAVAAADVVFPICFIFIPIFFSVFRFSATQCVDLRRHARNGFRVRRKTTNDGNSHSSHTNAFPIRLTANNTNLKWKPFKFHVNNNYYMIMLVLSRTTLSVRVRDSFVGNGLFYCRAIRTIMLRILKRSVCI